MRSFAFHILLLGFLTANLGLCSPVPYLTDTLEGLGVVDSKDNQVADHNVTEILIHPTSDLNETWDLEDCKDFLLDCRFRDPIEEDEAREILRESLGHDEAHEVVFTADPAVEGTVRGTCVQSIVDGLRQWRCVRDGNAALDDIEAGDAIDPDIGVNQDEVDYADLKRQEDLMSFTSLPALHGRQLIDPTFPGIDKPCVKAIIAKYNHVDLEALFPAERTTILQTIMDCINSFPKITKPISASEATDANVASETVDPCSEEMIWDAYFNTHLGTPEQQRQLIWWIVLTYCMKH